MKFPIWFSAGLIAVSVTTATATPQDASHELSPAEEFVVAQVTAGEAANLDTALNADHTKKFPEEKDRKLTAHFLEDLLTGTLRGVKLHRHGVGIYWAIVDEEIDLKKENFVPMQFPIYLNRTGTFVIEVIAMELLIVLALVAIFEYAVARWAHDSRDGFGASRR